MTIAALEAELAVAKIQLREAEERERRLASLYEEERTAHAEAREQLKAVTALEQVYRVAGETVRFGVWVASPEGAYTYISPSFLELLNMTLPEAVEQAILQLRSFDKSKARLHPEDAEALREKWLHSIQTGDDLTAEFRVDDRQGKTHSVRTKGRIVRDDRGRIISWAGTNLDITELKQGEEEIRRQAELIHELSTPVLEISAGLLIVPLIGPINARRARDLTEQLLHAVCRGRAKVVVVDVTGVATMDSFVANHLIKTAEACRLLGARVILTGISTPVARTLTEVGVQLTGIRTAGNLRSGIELAKESLQHDQE